MTRTEHGYVLDDGGAVIGVEGPTVEELADALDLAVTELVAWRHRRYVAEKTEPRPLYGIPSSVLLGTSNAVWQARSVADDPVVWGLRKAIREIGRLLYDQLGSKAKLVELAYAVGDRDPARFESRMSPIDSAFNGIGSGNDIWVS